MIPLQLTLLAAINTRLHSTLVHHWCTSCLPNSNLVPANWLLVLSLIASVRRDRILFTDFLQSLIATIFFGSSWAARGSVLAFVKWQGSWVAKILLHLGCVWWLSWQALHLKQMPPPATSIHSCLVCRRWKARTLALHLRAAARWWRPWTRTVCALSSSLEATRSRWWRTRCCSPRSAAVPTWPGFDAAASEIFCFCAWIQQTTAGTRIISILAWESLEINCIRVLNVSILSASCRGWPMELASLKQLTAVFDLRSCFCVQRTPFRIEQNPNGSQNKITAQELQWNNGPAARKEASNCQKKKTLLQSIVASDVVGRDSHFLTAY